MKIEDFKVAQEKFDRISAAEWFRSTLYKETDQHQGIQSELRISVENAIGKAVSDYITKQEREIEKI